MIPLGEFYDKCFIVNFEYYCYSGFFVIFFGFILLILNAFAFIKMTKFYGKMNFENTILLLSSIQSIFLLVEIIISKNILISFFIFLQILSMCLINFKFKKISKGFFNLKYYNLTKIIAIINIIYLFIFISIFFIITLKITERDLLFYLSIFYYLLEIISSFLLTYNCCAFLGIIKQYKLNEIPKNTEETENYFLKSNMVGDGLFYLIKKRQISLLYLGNVLCTIIEFSFDFLLTFIFDDKSDISHYFYYSYFFLCFIHNSIVFISFYWLIRTQYSNTKKEMDNDNIEEDEENRLIDEKFIKEEIINIEHENKRISGYIDEDKKNKFVRNDDDLDEFSTKENDNNNTSNNNTNNNNDKIFDNQYNGFIIINDKKN